MTDDLVKRLRRDLASGLSASIGDTQDAADRIEELEKSISNMQEDLDILNRLRLAGVDNWDGYDFAMEGKYD